MKRLAVLLAFAGCATTSQPQKTESQPAQAIQQSPQGPRSPSSPPSEEEQPQHGHKQKGPQVPIALPHRVVDGNTGDELAERALDEKLRAAKVIFVGEQHPNPHDHAAELEVLERAFAVDPSLGFGFEMLPRTYQGSLDAYVAGQIDEAAFLKAVDWQHTWGFAWTYYKPLVDFCRAHHLPAFALNAPRALAHTVAFKGLEALSADEKAQLPKMIAGPAAHREMVREAFAQHPHSRFDGEEFERFYTAQLIWDETMADRVAAALTGEQAPKHLVVVAGSGHTLKFAIPERAARRGATPFLTILPVLDEDEADARNDKVADVLWVLKTR